MGGRGSGNRFRAGKTATSDMRQVDVRRLHRENYLQPGSVLIMNWMSNDAYTAYLQIRPEPDHVILSYTNTFSSGEERPIEYPVRLEWTGLHLGGRRPWFICPADGCGRRVAILYGGKVYACRHCHQLAYQCQRETSWSRMIRRIDRLRDRLGWEPGMAYGEYGKPKGMHWQTFERLTGRYRDTEEQILASIRRQYGLG
jgi:hypothetical protein